MNDSFAILASISFYNELFLASILSIFNIVPLKFLIYSSNFIFSTSFSLIFLGDSELFKLICYLALLISS